jgi:hypothetical protein
MFYLNYFYINNFLKHIYRSANLTINCYLCDLYWNYNFQFANITKHIQFDNNNNKNVDIKYRVQDAFLE